MAQTILDALGQAWTNYLAAIARFLPRVLATLSILLAGLLMALGLRLLTRRVLGWLRFNALAERLGAAEALRKAQLPAADALAAATVFWLVLVGFLLSGLDALGFRGIDGLVAEFVHFIPRLAVALVILALGLLAANFVWRATLLAAVNAHFRSARFLSDAVYLFVVVLSVAMALEQLGVAKTVVLTAFAIAFGAVMLGLAIAFGIGGGAIARRLLEEQFPERKQDAADPSSHL